jgi:hypothetical protein
MRLALSALSFLLAGCVHRPWAAAAAGTGTVRILPGEGVGNVALGMRKARVKRRLGEPEGMDVFQGKQAYWNYPSLGLSVRFEGRRVASVFCYSGLRGGYETRSYQPFPGATPEGVTVKDGRAEVLMAYGQPDTFEEDKDAPIPAYWLIYGEGLGFCLTTAQDRIVYLYVD